MNTKNFIPNTLQFIDSDDIRATTRALTYFKTSRGRLVEDFEQEFAQKCRAKYAVLFNSDTAAFQGVYYAVNATEYDHIFLSPNSSINAVIGAIQRRSKIDLIDIEFLTGLLNNQLLSEKLSTFRAARGSPIIFVSHFAGLSANMKEIFNGLHHPNPVIIEDASHAIGAKYRGYDDKVVGCCEWSDMTVFSLQTSSLVSANEGGVVTTNDLDYYHRLRLYRNNGIERHPQARALPYPNYAEVLDITGNFNPTNTQTALALSQLQKLEIFVQKRKELLQYYRQRLQNIPHLTYISEEYDSYAAYSSCNIQIEFSQYKKQRKNVMESLARMGVGSHVIHIPLYHHPAIDRYKSFNHESFPSMEKFYNQSLSLPLFHELKERQIDHICHSLLKALRNK
ncbi:MAG: hypothetical protein K0S74_600 [Chlamydiales bacterium]|nr:hypothetical protein [Chlamydiales bacterium]